MITFVNKYKALFLASMHLLFFIVSNESFGNMIDRVDVVPSDSIDKCLHVTWAVGRPDWNIYPSAEITGYTITLKYMGRVIQTQGAPVTDEAPKDGVYFYNLENAKMYTVEIETSFQYTINYENHNSTELSIGYGTTTPGQITSASITPFPNCDTALRLNITLPHPKTWLDHYEIYIAPENDLSNRQYFSGAVTYDSQETDSIVLDYGLNPETEYHVWVRPVVTEESDPNKSYGPEFVEASGSTILPPPYGLKITKISQNDSNHSGLFRLSFTDPSMSEACFHVYRSDYNSNTWNLLSGDGIISSSQGSGSTITKDVTLTDVYGQIIYLGVTAYVEGHESVLYFKYLIQRVGDPNGNGPLLICPFQAPYSFSGTFDPDSPGNQIKLSWNVESTDNIDHFEIYRRIDDSTWILCGKTAYNEHQCIDYGRDILDPDPNNDSYLLTENSSYHYLIWSVNTLGYCSLWTECDASTGSSQ